jgi:uncharacterized membrane protein YdjX (TVP38/TMEM64 family)
MKTRVIATMIALAVILVAVLVSPARQVLVHSVALLATGQLAQFQHYLQSLGPWAPVVSISLMTIEALAVPVPVTIIMVANGLVFGLWEGMLVSLVGGLTGGLAAYLIGRLLGRPVVERFVPASGLATADRLMAKYGRWAIVLERWIPGIPGDPMSYAAGITRVPVLTFWIFTTIGLVPANFVTAFVGEQVADDVPLKYWLAGLAVVGVGWAMWKLARRKPKSDLT